MSTTSRMISKQATRRPCGNKTTASWPESQQANRTNAAQVRAKRATQQGKDKRAISVSTKDTTTTVTVSRKPLITVTVNCNTKTTKNTRAHARRPTRGAGATRPPQPVARRKTSTQQPGKAVKPKLKEAAIPVAAVAVEPTVSTTTETTSSLSTDVTTSSLISTESRNPQYCEEYAEDIFEYLLNRERQPCFAVEKEFLDGQIDVKCHHRRILVDWMVQVQDRYALLPETIHMAIDILDRYLQATLVLKSRLQLVGVTSLFIAAKYEEIYPPMCNEMAYITADTFTVEDLCKTERAILHTLDYQINKPMSLAFLRRFSKQMAVPCKMHNLAKYILELCFMYSSTSSYLPSMKAAASLLIADSILSPTPSLSFSRERWFTSIALLRVKRVMLAAFIEGHNNKRCKSIRKKFASLQYFEVSKISELAEYS